MKPKAHAAGELPKPKRVNFHGICTNVTHQTFPDQKQQRHTCKRCVCDAFNKTPHDAPLKARLREADMSYFCPYCVANSLASNEGVGLIDPSALFPRRNCPFACHAVLCDLAKAPCGCPRERGCGPDASYCKDSLNPLLVAGTRRCFNTPHVLCRTFCQCGPCGRRRHERRGSLEAAYCGV